ncbi:MAG: hypothetical protein Q9165_007536 [Trypethelium subeluteriae]
MEYKGQARRDRPYLAKQNYKASAEQLRGSSVYGRRTGFEREGDYTDTPKAGKETWKIKYEKLEDQTRAHEEAIRLLQKELGKQADELEQARRSAGQMQIELENKEFSLGRQATDADLQSDFESILNGIRTWATNFDEKGTAELKQDRLQEYLRVTPNQTPETLRSILQEKKKRRLFIRGWAASVMCACLIRSLPRLSYHPEPGSFDRWLDKKSSALFGDLELRLLFAARNTISDRAFNDWRALTADLLARSSRSADEAIRAAADGAVREVMALVEPWAPHSRQGEIRDLLGGIFDDAIRFSRALRTQRASWYVRWPQHRQDLGPSTGDAQHHRMMFEPTEMKDEKGDDDDMDPNFLRRQSVEMVVTPALFKSGTSKGERFDEEFCAVKAKVLMSNGSRG